MTELPTPVGMMAVTYGFDHKVKLPVYDEKQMREYAQMAVLAEREAIVEEFAQFMLEVDKTPRTASTKFVSSLLRVTGDKFFEIIRERGQAMCPPCNQDCLQGRACPAREAAQVTVR